MPIGFKIIAESLPRVLKSLGQLPAETMNEMSRTVDRYLIDVLRDSKTKPPRVPVDTGALQSTGFIEPTTTQGTTIRATIGYGGVAANGKTVDYAVFLHENMNGRFKNFKRPGSGPKWLETPLRNRQPELNAGLQTAFTQAVRKVLG
jgi:hypothetical protein